MSSHVHVAGAPPPGTVLAGKYRVDRVLGSGGMGFVLAATHLQIDEPVAVKLLHAELAKDPDTVLRFEREAKAARKIKSEHVVRILDVGTLESGAPYLVMEYLEGTDLDGVVQRTGRQPVQTAVDYLLQAMEALAEAHVQGMVHRDLKPANLFVTRRADGSPLVKVLDFGISKVTGTGGAELNLTKTDAKVLGSPLYMAPEQMRSLRTVDARTDIWALGVILYEMLAGVPPFNGATMTELCAVILQDSPPPIRGYRPDVPPQIEHILRSCLEKDPARRYPNVAALANDMAALASPTGRISIDRIAGVLRVVGPTMSAPPAAIVVSAPPPRPNITTAPQSWGQATQPAPQVRINPGAPNRGLMFALIGATVMGMLAVGMGIYAWKSKGPVTEIHYLSDPKSKGGDGKSDDPTKSHADDDAPDVKDDKKASYPADIVRIVPSGGNYGRPFDVTLSTRTPNAVIHYTTDHTEPSASSPVYTKPIHVDKTTLIKAIAIAPGRTKSWPKFESYLLFPNALEAPEVVNLGETACGAAPKSQTFTVKNHGAATTFHVEMKDGAQSKYTVSGDGPLPAKGEALIKVSLKASPTGLEVLDGITETLTIDAANGLHRDVSVTAIATGPAFEVLDDSEITFDDVPLNKKSSPELVRIRNRGSVDSILNLATSGTGGFEVTPLSIAIPVGQLQTVRVTYKPNGPIDATGALHVSHPSNRPGCTPTSTVKLKGHTDKP